MAVPKKRLPSARRDRRRANIKLKEPQLVKCKKCGALTIPHAACQECGFYKGKEYINTMKKVEKKPAKQEEKLSAEDLSKKK
jgi:large subunit ribosomal protein L32